MLTGFFFAVGLARMASTDVALLDVVLVKLVTSAFGHMTVFSQWLAEYWQETLTAFATFADNEEESPSEEKE